MLFSSVPWLWFGYRSDPDHAVRLTRMQTGSERHLQEVLTTVIVSVRSRCSTFCALSMAERSSYNFRRYCFSPKAARAKLALTAPTGGFWPTKMYCISIAGANVCHIHVALQMRGFCPKELFSRSCVRFHLFHGAVCHGRALNWKMYDLNRSCVF